MTRTNLNIYHRPDMKKMAEQGYKWVVALAYEAYGEPKGTVLSRHRTYEAADRKCPDNGFYGLYEVEA